MYCAFILIHSDAYYWKKVPHTVMNRSSHGQTAHLTCAMGMIAQRGSCSPHYRQANREILPSCLSTWDGLVVKCTLQYYIYTHMHLDPVLWFPMNQMFKTLCL